jgi:hypothetical protein
MALYFMNIKYKELLQLSKIIGFLQGIYGTPFEGEPEEEVCNIVKQLDKADTILETIIRREMGE